MRRSVGTKRPRQPKKVATDGIAVHYGRIMPSDTVIGVFTPEQASRISGVSLSQISDWDRQGFFRPSIGAESAHVPYGRLYSFRDLVSLQVLHDLRNEKRIPLGHLKDVSEKLAHLGDQRWTSTTLYVLGKRVVFESPETRERHEVVSGQRVFNIPLRVVIRSTRDRILQLNDRSAVVGVFAQGRFVSQNAKVFSGTRVPVSTILEFVDAGYSPEQVVEEFPVLSVEDVRSAIAARKADIAA